MLCRNSRLKISTEPCSQIHSGMFPELLLQTYLAETKTPCQKSQPMQTFPSSEDQRINEKKGSNVGGALKNGAAAVVDGVAAGGKAMAGGIAAGGVTRACGRNFENAYTI